MVGIGKYAGIRFKNLSMTPLNDVKLMSTTLRKADYCLENSFENIKSKRQFEDIIDAYVESINRSPEEIGKFVKITIITNYNYASKTVWY